MARDSQRFHRPDLQTYAIDQARDRHSEVLFKRGEYAMFVLMWKTSDFEAGRVGRCPTCVDVYGDDVTLAFGGQPSEMKCPDCYGTGFEGGYRAKIVRPSLWTFDVAMDEPEARRGKDLRRSAAVQSTFDFSMKTGDYIFRSDGGRWFARAPKGVELATGFGVLSDAGTALAFNYSRVDLEPQDSVAYLIEPTPDALAPLLQPVGHGMVDFSSIEHIRDGAVLV